MTSYFKLLSYGSKFYILFYDGRHYYSITYGVANVGSSSIDEAIVSFIKSSKFELKYVGDADDKIYSCLEYISFNTKSDLIKRYPELIL